MRLFNFTTLCLFYALIVGLLIFYLIFLYQKWRFIKFSWNTNGFFLPILPIVGTSYVSLFTGLKVNPISLIQWAEEYIKFPLIFWFGHTFNYVTNDANEAKILLTHPKCYNKAAFYESLKYFFEGSIALAPYEIWKAHRQHFLRSFTPSMVKTYFPIFYRQSCQLVDELQFLEKPDNLFDYFSKYSFTNFFLNSTGLDEDKMFSDMGRVGVLINDIQNLLRNILLNPFLRPAIWYKWFPSGRTTNYLFKELKTYVSKIIEEKRKQQKYSKMYIENRKRVNLFDLMLMVNNKHLTDDEILEQLSLFVTAATDTSAFTLACCFVLLGMHPEIQETIYKEVTDLIGDFELTFEDIPNLKYTEAVICETMRIFPALPIVGRVCDDDVDLGTKVLPKGTSCMINIYHIHRNPDNWPDPLKVDPTRFLPENQSKIKPYSFLGFSGGPRDCIGKTQAMILLKTTIANVVRNFTITTKHQSIDELCLESTITMKTTNPLDCHFKPRHNK